MTSWSEERLAAWRASVERHPWTNPVESEVSEVGDPRDMTVPAHRYGMTVHDEGEWLRAVNAHGDALRGESSLRHADRFARDVEVRIGWMQYPTLEDVFAAVALMNAPLSPLAQALLDVHWIYGARFHTWREAQKSRAMGTLAVNQITPLPTPRAREIRKGDYVRRMQGVGRWAQVTGVSPTQLHVTLDGIGQQWLRGQIADHRPAPHITLPDGREVAVKLQFRISGTDIRWAVAEGKTWRCSGQGTWQVVRDHAMSIAGFSPKDECIWPPVHEYVPAQRRYRQ